MFNVCVFESAFIHFLDLKNHITAIMWFYILQIKPQVPESPYIFGVPHQWK